VLAGDVVAQVLTASVDVDIYTLLSFAFVDALCSFNCY